MEELIRFKNVSLQLNHRPILANINLTIHSSAKIAVVGKSGSGKSSLLNLIVGRYIPTSGEIYFKQKLLTRHTISEVRSSIAFIGQEPVLGAENVREALLLPFKFSLNKQLFPTQSAIDNILEILLLPSDILDQKTDDISGGEKQRLAIARALLLKKTIFLLDEITSALDKLAKKAVLELFCKEDNFTILTVTHDSEWQESCEQMLEIEAGEIRGVIHNGRP